MRTGDQRAKNGANGMDPDDRIDYRYRHQQTILNLRRRTGSGTEAAPFLETKAPPVVERAEPLLVGHGTGAGCRPRTALRDGNHWKSSVSGPADTAVARPCVRKTGVQASSFPIRENVRILFSPTKELSDPGEPDRDRAQPQGENGL